MTKTELSKALCKEARNCTAYKKSLADLRSKIIQNSFTEDQLIDWLSDKLYMETEHTMPNGNGFSFAHHNVFSSNDLHIFAQTVIEGMREWRERKSESAS